MIYLLALVLVLCLVNLVLGAMLLMRGKADPSGAFASLEKSAERTDRTVREEISRNREESTKSAQALREELSRSLGGLSDSLLKRMAEAGRGQAGQLESFGGALANLVTSNEARFEAVRTTLEKKLSDLQGESQRTAGADREEATKSFTAFTQLLLARMTDATALQTAQLDNFTDRLNKLSESNNLALEQMRQTVERKLSAMQVDNNQKLELMRATVDEKLHATLEQRLGESFKIVSDRLELVHKGLGEMQSLATGVGDLKKVLTNIKTRGNWGEVQLGNLLEQMLTPDQYEANVQVNPMSAERVDFAIKLPGRDGNSPGSKPLWLPIDAKFPQEDYQRLVDAADRADAGAVAESAAALEARVIGEAKKIKAKYIHSPDTTDFAILFLPTEGLFAEVLRRPGLCDGIQRDYRVILAGPTTLAAVLSSLQMGFRTLIIEKRSSEVWQVLGGIKTEFSKFGTVLEGVQKKLQQASNGMDDIAQRSRAMERKLRTVQELPTDGSLPTPILPGLEAAILSADSEAAN